MRYERLGTLITIENFANEQCIDQSSEKERCSNIYLEHFTKRCPTVLGGGHRQALGTNAAPLFLRNHSFPPGASPHPLPSPFQRPLGRCFMNCVHEYFGAYRENVVFLKSRIRTSGTWILSFRKAAAQTVVLQRDRTCHLCRQAS